METMLDVESFVSKGYVVLGSFLRAEQIELLRMECSLLCKTHGSDGSEIVKRGCVIQPLSPPPPPRMCKEASKSVHAFHEFRANAVRHGRKRLSKLVSEMVLSSREYRDVVTQLLGERYYFYNEQYIIKPAGHDQATEFPLHRDSDSAKTDSAYISLWVALDEITSENGGLFVVPYETMQPIPLHVDSGDVVILSHDVLHGSYPNFSNSIRRAYMAQFSQAPMLETKTTDDLVQPGLLAFALQLGVNQ